MSLHIQTPWFILLLVPLAIAVFLAFRKRPPALRVSTVDRFTDTKPGVNWRHPTRLPVYLYAVALVCMTAALMRPQRGIEKTVERTRGVDIMLMLDVSGSMQVFDIPPAMNDGNDVAEAIREERLKTRIETAKDELARFVRQRPHDRIGLIAFAKLPYVVCPPTLDHDFLLNHLSTLDAGMFGDDGTGIAAPIASATSRLKDSDAKRRVAVLFTDGENNVEASISPKQAAKIAAKFDVAVYTVGIGSDRAMALIDTLVGQRLRRVPSALDQEMLQAIADATGARYFTARDQQSFEQVMEEIDEIETIELEQPRYIDYSDRFFPWLLAGLILVLTAALLENTALLRAP